MLAFYYQGLLLFILNSIYKLTAGIKNRTRDVIMKCWILLLFAFFIIVRSPVLTNLLIGSILPTKSSRYLLATVIFCGFIVFSINAPLKRVNWRPVIIIPMALIGIGAFVASLLHSVGDGYRLFGIQLLFVFPSFYLVWNNRQEYKELFRTCSYFMTGTCVVLFLLTYILAFEGRLVISDDRVAGIMYNANVFSLIGMELVLGGIYLLFTENVSLLKHCYLGLITGTGLGIILIGKMRIAAFLVIVCSLVALFYHLRYFRQNKKKNNWAFIVIGLIIMTIMMNVTSHMVEINERAIGIQQTAESTENAKTEEQDAIAADTNTQEKNEDDEGISDDLIDLSERFKITPDHNTETYSSGRVEIWRNYAEKLNMWGNNYDDFDPSMTVAFAPYAHNMFLEVAFRCGIPTGIMTIALLLFCGIVCLRYLFVNDNLKKKYLLFPIISVIVFVMESLLDCAVLPFFQTEALLYYLSIVVIVDVWE